MTNPTISLRASQAPMWADCPARAEYLLVNPNPAGRQISVGAAVGNAVHNAITGHQYEPADTISYDQHTRTARDMTRQVKRLSMAADKFLKEDGLDPVEKETRLTARAQVGKVDLLVEGTIDLVCKEGDKYCLVDLKTGARQPRAAWAQLAVYAWLWSHSRDEELSHCEILWLPRSAKPVAPEPKRWRRDANELLKYADALLRQVAMTASTGQALPNPSSLSCYDCPVVDCAVRIN